MSRSIKRVVVVATVIALIGVPVVAGAISGLNGPLFGLSTARNGNLLVADASTGILEFKGDRLKSTIALPGVTDVSQSGRRSLWATTGAGADPTADTGQGLYIIRRGEPEKIINLFEFEAANNPDGEAVFDSNPFDVESLGRKAALVADAGANALLKVDHRGKAKVLAIFPTTLASTANIKELAGCPASGADLCSLPEEMPAQAVPTSVAIGPDGWYYVGELRGFPGPTGESSIWKVHPRAKNAVCGESSKCVKVFDGGFTSIIDLAFKRGSLYVAEMDEASWAAVEVFADGVGGTINKCSLRSLECKTVAEGIPQLTAITFAKHGKLYATQNVLVPGAAEVIRVETHKHRR